MSHIQRRSSLRNGKSNPPHTALRSQPSILKTKKRKLSENEDSQKSLKREHSSENVIVSPSTSSSPLEDVTATSLNVVEETDRVQAPESLPEPDEWNRFRTFTCFPTPQTKRNVPLPHLEWADREKVWEVMCRKDNLYKVNPGYLNKHPCLQARMRTIVLDWLTEVCEVYKLHRETFYLAVSYIDRFMALSEDIPKSQLQLIGITALYIAAKIEEIYPPKLCEFVFVTDKACSEEQILTKELIILKILNWDLTPVTCVSWLNTFMQLVHNKCVKQTSGAPLSGADFLLPKYSTYIFLQVARLLDLCTYDTSSLTFTQSELAATALSFSIHIQTACQVSGYAMDDLRECRAWMSPLAVSLTKLGPVPMKQFLQISIDDLHNIQRHSIDMEVFDIALERRAQMEEMTRISPPNLQPINPEVLTPPKTDEKPKKEHMD